MNSIFMLMIESFYYLIDYKQMNKLGIFALNRINILLYLTTTFRKEFRFYLIKI
jgi:hypothetical protein